MNGAPHMPITRTAEEYRPMSNPDALPPAVQDLARRLGADPGLPGATVRLSQSGHIKLDGLPWWLPFGAEQTIAAGTCAFAWTARIGPLGALRVCDALEQTGGRLDVSLFGTIPLAHMARTPALRKGELLRYLAELPWAPDAIIGNPALRWRVEAPDRIAVSAGAGEAASEVALSLNGEGHIAGVYAADRPRSATPPIRPTPWRGSFSDYRYHAGRWLPFTGEVAWEVGGVEQVYWRGTLLAWEIDHDHA